MLLTVQIKSLQKNCALRKCMRWWKTLVFHLIDIAVVNNYTLFDPAEHPDNEALKRPQNFAVFEYREELVRDLEGLNEYGQPPVLTPPTKEPGVFVNAHIPKFTYIKMNCRVCYKSTQKEMKVRTYCNAPRCNNVYLHCTQDKDCFEIWHSKDYHCDRLRKEICS